MVCSTGDIKKSYDILQIVHIFHSGLLNKSTFGTDKITAEEIFEKLVERISKKAEDKGADGLIYLRSEIYHVVSGYAIHTDYHLYGTAVKIVE